MGFRIDCVALQKPSSSVQTSFNCFSAYLQLELLCLKISNGLENYHSENIPMNTRVYIIHFA